jgi:hypothetical protein
MAAGIDEAKCLFLGSRFGLAATDKARASVGDMSLPSIPPVGF